MLREDFSKSRGEPGASASGPSAGRKFGRAKPGAVIGAAVHAPKGALIKAQAAALYRNGPFAFLLNLLNSVLLAAVLWWAEVAPNAVLGWFALLSASIAVRFLLWRTYRADGDDGHARRWLQGYTIGAGVSGLLWAATLLFMNQGAGWSHALVIVFVLVGMVAAAVAASAMYLPATLAFNAPILAALAVNFALGRTMVELALCALMAVFFAFFGRMAANHQKALVEQVDLQTQNAKLAESLEYAVRETRDREEKFRIIADYSFGWEAWFSADARLLWVNPGVERITGYTAAECHAMKDYPLELVHADDRDLVAKCLAAGLRAPTRQEVEFRIAHKNGTTRWCAALAQPAVDSEGRANGFRMSVRDISDRKALQDELEILASTDPLTGVYNRRRFFHEAESELYRARRYDRPLVVVEIDIDHFKKINDTHGHGVGDDCLKTLATLIKNRLRRSDLFARIGGEEFVMLFPETQLGDALRLSERIRKQIEGVRIETPNGAVGFTVSMGVADFKREGDSLNQLLARADAALYRAKRDGRNQVAYGAPEGLEAAAVAAQANGGNGRSAPVVKH